MWQHRRTRCKNNLSGKAVFIIHRCDEIESIPGLFRMACPATFKVSILNDDSAFLHSKLSTNSYITLSYNFHYITKSNSVSICYNFCRSV